MQFEKLQSFANNVNNSVLKLIIDDVVKGFDEALKDQFKENLFMTRSVEEIVWGYSDPFLKFIADMNLPIAAIPKGGMFSLEVSVYVNLFIIIIHTNMHMYMYVINVSNVQVVEYWKNV